MNAIKGRMLAVGVAVVLVSVERALEAAGLEFIPENGGGAGIRFRMRKDGTRDEY